VIDRPYPGDRPRHAADGALKLVRGRTARLVTGAVQAGTNAAYLAAKARRGGHDLLSRGLERATEPHWNAGPIAGPAHLGTKRR
jgi:hypothetical protein